MIDLSTLYNLCSKISLIPYCVDSEQEWFLSIANRASFSVWPWSENGDRHLLSLEKSGLNQRSILTNFCEVVDMLKYAVFAVEVT